MVDLARRSMAMARYEIAGSACVLHLLSPRVLCDDIRAIWAVRI
jgi:hypothetical protein